MPRSFLLAGLMAVLPAAAVQAQGDETRQVSGAVGYLQRIALPPDARAVVVAEGRFGAMLGEVTLDADGKQVPLPFGMTVPANLSGIPGISVPAALTEDGLPLGLQVLGPAFDEEIVFRVAHVLERAAAFDATPQDWWSDTP